MTSSQIETLKNSRSGALALRVARFIQGLAPVGTKRRRFITRIAGAVRAIKWNLKAILGISSKLGTSPNPEVTILIPTYGKWAFTRRCLHSIRNSELAEIQYEVVVLDDFAPERSFWKLRRLFKGVRFVQLTENLGFTKAVNYGLTLRNSRQVVLLNNDTVVHGEWLKALLQTGSRSDAGIVGAKLVYEDGVLQEAGGIIFRDGSGWNYGRYADASDPRFNYTREVDYCSGAAILLTERLLYRVPSFDERYAPAYYEDTDFAFECRKAGLKVIYEPKALVTHFEGVSHGTDEAIGLKSFQTTNLTKFEQKWQRDLVDHLENDSAIVEIAARRLVGRTIVIFEHMVPRWLEDSGSLRLKRVIDLLIASGRSVVFVPRNRIHDEKYASALQSLGVLVWHGHFDIWDYLRQIEQSIECVFISRLSVALDVFGLVRERLPNAPVIFDTVDLHFVREERKAEHAGDLSGSHEVTRALEIAISKLADVTTVVGEAELETLAQAAQGANVMLLSNVHDANESFVQIPGSATEIVFVGSFAHDPNVDAVEWLIDEIFPIVSAKHPEIILRVVGGNVPESLLRRSSQLIQFSGWVDDLEPVHMKTLVSVAPIRYGAGVKGKVGDAWSHRLPVVLTSVAAESMGVVDGENALVADSSDDFARAILRIIEDGELRALIAEGGYQTVKRKFGSMELIEQLNDAISAAEFHKSFSS